MPQKLVTLQVWASAVYGEAAPCLNTLRRWAREALIVPAPVKHGRAFFVDPEAQYQPYGNSPTLASRLRGDGARGTSVPRRSLNTT